MRPDDGEAISERLRALGLRPWGRAWVLFAGCSANLVELIPAATLGLPEAELEALYAEATPLGGLEKVVEPAPHHALLILARKLAREPRVLPKHRGRVERALSRDPGAWREARGRAQLWRAERALDRLSAVHAHGEACRGRRLLPLPRPRRTRVIAFSGGNGEQRAWHAEALRGTLARLGFDAVVDRPLPESSAGAGLGLPGAFEAALALWRPVWRHPVRGKVLIYDRSALDVAASVWAGEETPGTLSRSFRLLRRLAPTALCSYVFAQAEGRAAPGEAEEYRAAADAFGASLLDPDRSAEDLCEEIAEEVWGALTRQTALASALRKLPAPVDLFRRAAARLDRRRSELHA